MSTTTRIRSLSVGKRIILKTGAAIEDEAGKALVNASGIQIRGTWYFVDPLAGSNTANGLTISTAVADLQTAYGLCADGAGDGIIFLSVTSTSTTYSILFKQPLTWSKWGITVVGMAVGGYNSRARISTTTVTTTATMTQTAHSFVRTSGSFITDGWEVGMKGTCVDAGANNGATFAVTAVAALTLTFSDSFTPVTEGIESVLTPYLKIGRAHV